MTEQPAATGVNGADKSKLRGITRSAVDASVIGNARKRLGISMVELGNAIGVADNSLSTYVRNKRCPAYVALACEALVRRQAPGVEPDTVWVIRLVKGMPQISVMQDVQQAVIGDKCFLMIPND